jgi:hypothetical protein
MNIAVLANLKKDVPLIKEHPPGDDYWDDLDEIRKRFQQLFNLYVQ